MSESQTPLQPEARERLPQPEARRPSYRLRIFQVLAVLVFVGLAIPAAANPYFGFDPIFSRDVQQLRSPLLDAVMLAVSRIGYFWPATIILITAAGALWLARFRVEAIFVLATALGDALGRVVKVLVARPRPLDELVQVTTVEMGDSFPSAHVLHYVVFYGFLIYLALTLLPRGPVRYLTAGVLALPILLIGLSRVYLGAHWTSDVLGGYLLGAICLSLLIPAYRWFKANWELAPRAPFVRPRRQPGRV